MIRLATGLASRYSSPSALAASAVAPISLWWFGDHPIAMLFLILTALLWYMAERPAADERD